MYSSHASATYGVVVLNWFEIWASLGIMVRVTAARAFVDVVARGVGTASWSLEFKTYFDASFVEKLPTFTLGIRLS